MMKMKTLKTSLTWIEMMVAMLSHRSLLSRRPVKPYYVTYSTASSSTDRLSRSGNLSIFFQHRHRFIKVSERNFLFFQALENIWTPNPVLKVLEFVVGGLKCPWILGFQNCCDHSVKNITKLRIAIAMFITYIISSCLSLRKVFFKNYVMFAQVFPKVCMILSNFCILVQKIVSFMFWKPRNLSF